MCSLHQPRPSPGFLSNLISRADERRSIKSWFFHPPKAYIQRLYLPPQSSPLTRAFKCERGVDEARSAALCALSDDEGPVPDTLACYHGVGRVPGRVTLVLKGARVL
ncbi:hypothetical protein H0G86_003188 [Trichoderma simmonsii]|uniref:Uncharacterized protein n=1 Tax=Trichoderma simmonsii TaxID=1491479 RepID=A0A8G0LA54_9HYPO|nr:hypothetical protein H0G86_003188 [Trichoderma simmonsii]